MLYITEIQMYSLYWLQKNKKCMFKKIIIIFPLIIT